ncbi:hypothetical protein AKO1_015022 [Acrasis kona]|uniref:Uncharacterized protein n=1 Tax=Acrasis kona TaxID=1008807 RepID=A0AAW2YZP5_9EUKA
MKIVKDNNVQEIIEKVTFKLPDEYIRKEGILDGSLSISREGPLPVVIKLTVEIRSGNRTFKMPLNHRIKSIGESSIVNRITLPQSIKVENNVEVPTKITFESYIERFFNENKNGPTNPQNILIIGRPTATQYVLAVRLYSFACSTHYLVLEDDSVWAGMDFHDLKLIEGLNSTYPVTQIVGCNGRTFILAGTQVYTFKNSEKLERVEYFDALRFSNPNHSGSVRVTMMASTPRIIYFLMSDYSVYKFEHHFVFMTQFKQNNTLVKNISCSGNVAVFTFTNNVVFNLDTTTNTEINLGGLPCKINFGDNLVVVNKSPQILVYSKKVSTGPIKISINQRIEIQSLCGTFSDDVLHIVIVSTDRRVFIAVTNFTHDCNVDLHEYHDEYLKIARQGKSVTPVVVTADNTMVYFKKYQMTALEGYEEMIRTFYLLHNKRNSTFEDVLIKTLH